MRRETFGFSQWCSCCCEIKFNCNSAYKTMQSWIIILSKCKSIMWYNAKCSKRTRETEWLTADTPITKPNLDERRKETRQMLAKSHIQTSKSRSESERNLWRIAKLSCIWINRYYFQVKKKDGSYFLFRKYISKFIFVTIFWIVI